MERKEMNTLATRLTQAMTNAGVTQTELSNKVGVSQTAIQKLVSGKSKTSKKIFDIANCLGVDPVWLSSGQTPKPVSAWGGDTPMDSDDVTLSYYREVELAAGSGPRKIEFNSGRELRFSRRTLDRLGINPENAACVTVSGNSMEPVMPDGSTVGIDIGNTSIVDGDIYAIGQHNYLRVKIIYRIPWGGLRLRSYNSTDWPDETHDNVDDITILGRVFWYSALI